jgi:hypothetical protein
LPITRAAKEQLGREVVANMLALGAINAGTGLVDRQIFRESIYKLAPKGSGELNQQAFDLGYRLYEEGMGAGYRSICSNPSIKGLSWLLSLLLLLLNFLLLPISAPFVFQSVRLFLFTLSSALTIF